MLDAQIKLAGEALGITTPEDWTQKTPEQVRAVHGCGPATVDHLRLYLAAKGLTLRNDATPAYWQANLAAARIGGQVAKTDRAVTCPFVVLVDKQEQQPWSFQGFMADADLGNRPLLVPCRVVSMGPTHGDYSIEGFEGACHIERKGPGDAHSTFLSAPGTDQRDRWEKTLQFLAGVQTAAIIVECSLGQMLTTLQARGKRSRSTLQKTIHRQVLAWEQDYRVPFIFCDSRRLAELTALAIMQRHYRHATKDQQAQNQLELDAAIAAL